MVHTSPVKLGKLFKVPRKRSPEHLTGMNIQEHYRVATAVIVGDANLPHDGNICIPRSHLPSLALASLTPFIAIPSLPFLLPYWRNSEVLPCTREHKHRLFFLRHRLYNSQKRQTAYKLICEERKPSWLG